MSFFGVAIEEIDKLEPIPGADFIEKATLKNVDFSFVVQKGVWQPNMKGLYFPLDSILPDDIAGKLGVLGKLSGSGKNRIKSKKLKGTISQGLIGPLSLIPEDMAIRNDPDEILSYFGIKKYEPDEINCNNCRMITLPSYLSVYDIPGCEREKAIVDLIMDEPVFIQEKTEGQNVSISVDKEGQLFVSQRRYTLIPKEGEEEHSIWKTAKEQGLIDFVQKFWQREKDKGNNTEITLYGENLGPKIQANIYKLNKFQINLFDIKIGSEWMEPQVFVNTLKEFDLDKWLCPVLCCGQTLREWLNGKTIKEASNGKSLLNPNVLREGIVIRPMKNMYHSGQFCRIKQRDPVYLAGSEN